MHPFASSNRFSRALGTALLTAVSLTAGVAFASPDYPTVTADYLVMQCTPDCTLCHTVSPGVAGTAEKPFVASLFAGGLTTGKNPEGLKVALEYVKTQGTDADDNAVTDVNELLGTAVGATDQLTTDPNTPEGTDAPSPDICPLEPKYGCGAAHMTARPHAHADLVVFGLLAGLVGLGLWRRFADRRQG